MSDFDADLLVVGLGPAGGVLTALACLQGLSVIAIDAEANIYPKPRAAVFDHEIMRVFQMIGLGRRIEPLCRVMDQYQFLTASGEVLLDFRQAAFVPDSGWAESYALHQPAVEGEIRKRLAELGADIRLSTKFTGLRQDNEGASSTMVGPAGAAEIRTRFVVGCDGASSLVRQVLKISMFDYKFDEPWLVIDGITDEPGDLPNQALQICDPRRPVTYVRMSDNRYRWEFMIKPSEDPSIIASDESIKALLQPWNCAERLHIDRSAVYRFHGLIANEWRVGRVLLAGDAAHQMPPFAGQGMCSSIRDSANLSWKINEIVKGRASLPLLDSYQTEREPHARAVIETAIAMGRVVCLLDEAAAAARNEAMLARAAAGESDISMSYPPLHGGMLTQTAGAGTFFPQPAFNSVLLDDKLGAGAWLIGRNLQSFEQAGVRAVDLHDNEISGFKPPIEAWLNAHGADAVLVRPDRQVFGSGHAEILLSEWRRMLNEYG